MVTWTKELADATRNLCRIPANEVDATRAALLSDIKERALTIASNLTVGATLSAMQNEYVNLMRSRLGDFLLSQHPTVAAWSKAYREA